MHLKIYIYTYIFLGFKIFANSCIYIKIIFIVCWNKQGRSPLIARGWERMGKNKGELSGLRRANSDAVDNEHCAAGGIVSVRD